MDVDVDMDVKMAHRETIMSNPTMQEPGSRRSCLEAVRFDALRTTGVVLAVAVASHAQAQQSADELAKKLANPIASLVSVPFQYNADFGVGPEDGTRQILNIQPVIPTTIGDDWNLITRVVVPLVAQDDVFGDSGSQSGLGDILPTVFFSPKTPTAAGLVWGVGPVFLLPTATDDRLGGEKWGAGPSVVLVEQTRTGWTVGVLANHVWSVAGDDDRADISSTFLQPFVSKSLGRGQTLSLNTESSYDWETRTWNVPVNLSYSRVLQLGEQLVSVSGGIRVYGATPGAGPDWGLRISLTLLFPK